MPERERERVCERERERKKKECVRVVDVPEEGNMIMSGHVCSREEAAGSVMKIMTNRA